MTSLDTVVSAVGAARQQLPELRPHKVAYVVSLFPCWSETFIAEEVDQLLKLGFDIQIHSLRPACEEKVHPLAQKLLSRTRYVDSYWDLFTAQLYFLFTKPTKYVGQFFRLLFGEGLPLKQKAKTLATFFIAAYFARLIKRDKAERIHAHWATFGTTGAWTISELTGLPFTFTTHAHDLFLPDELLPKKISAARKVITISEFNRKLLHDKYQAQGKVEIVHCGVDTDKFAPVASHNFSARKLLAVGRLAPIKGFPTLIQACGILKKQRVTFQCEIVGDGELKELLQREVIKADVGDCVTLSGFAPQEQVRAKLAEATMFVMPSEETKSNDRDGIPVALMEAMSMGIPVVSTYVSGIPELVENNISGLLVKPGRPEELAAAIATVLSDKALCERLTQRGKEIVLGEFDITRNARRLGMLFCETQQ